jgi:hypothetical protein
MRNIENALGEVSDKKKQSKKILQVFVKKKLIELFANKNWKITRFFKFIVPL